MSEKVIIVTAPDDVVYDGFRVLLVDLDNSHTAAMSQILNQLEFSNNAIFYMWKTGDDVEWLLDKKHKADYIVFNANSENDIIIGYLAAQKNAYYFGTLKTLDKANNRAIYNIDQILDLLERTINT